MFLQLDYFTGETSMIGVSNEAEGEKLLARIRATCHEIENASIVELVGNMLIYSCKPTAQLAYKRCPGYFVSGVFS